MWRFHRYAKIEDALFEVLSVLDLPIQVELLRLHLIGMSNQNFFYQVQNIFF